MRRLHVLSLIAVLALCVPLTAVAQADQDDYSNVRIVRLSFVQGDAQVFRPEQGEWEAARLNLPIQKAYAIATGRGRVEVEFESGATARLDEFTELEFTELAMLNGARITALRLERGSAIFYANGDKRDVFEVIHGNQRVRADRNARFRVDANNGELLVGVLKGNVDVESNFGTQELDKNQEMRITENGAAVARRGEPDDFERWALEREEVLSASYYASNRYVNAPFRYGVADLHHHGYWYHDLTYGYIWRPYAIGFTPYFNGVWVWVNGFGFSWVSYEPWGWLPYHYGRWVWTGYGWGWVPGHFRRWSPAHVAWVRFGDGRLGWCPLSPRDRHGRRPHNLGVVTAVWNGRRPVVRNVNNRDLPVVLTERPTRETLGAELGYTGRNPRIDRAARGSHGRLPAESGTVAGPRSGFSGATSTPDRPRANPEVTGRVPVARGDVRYDRDEGRYVNTPVREPDRDTTSPRSGWSGAANGRPRPNLPRSEEATPNADVNRYRPSGPTTMTNPRSGTAPRGDDSRGSGYSGRSPSHGQQPDRYSAPPRANTPPRSTPSQQPRYSPPPRSSQPPRQGPSAQPPRSSPPAQVRQGPSRSSSPPQVRQAPPRQSSSSQSHKRP